MGLSANGIHSLQSDVSMQSPPLYATSAWSLRLVPPSPSIRIQAYSLVAANHFVMRPALHAVFYRALEGTVHPRHRMAPP